MNQLLITSIVSHTTYEHAVVEDDGLTLSNLEIVHGTNEYNRIVQKANEGEQFYEFLPFYNYVGILTYNEAVGFELNLFRFYSFNEVLDLYNTFNLNNWSSTDKNIFSGIANNILNSNIPSATLKKVEIEN